MLAALVVVTVRCAFTVLAGLCTLGVMLTTLGVFSRVATLGAVLATLMGPVVVLTARCALGAVLTRVLATTVVVITLAITFGTVLAAVGVFTLRCALGAVLTRMLATVVVLALMATLATCSLPWWCRRAGRPRHGAHPGARPPLWCSPW
ncbi:hypothetical protein ACLESD_35605 [Pyxidicoccus sp. 3LFB2]